MRRAALIAFALAAILTGSALAAQGDPQKKITKAGQVRAKAAALTLADLGQGWKAERPSSSKDQSNPRCSSYRPNQSDLVETGHYSSPDFRRTDGSFVSSTTGVFRTAGMARTGYARVAVPALASCFAELFRKSVMKPNSVKILSVGPVAFPRYGDRSDAFRITAAFKVPSTTVPVTIDLVLFNRGRIDVAMIFFLASSKPLPAAFEQSLVARVAARAQ